MQESAQEIITANTVHIVIEKYCDISLPIHAQPNLMLVYEFFNKFHGALNERTIKK